MYYVLTKKHLAAAAAQARDHKNRRQGNQGLATFRGRIKTTAGQARATVQMARVYEKRTLQALFGRCACFDDCEGCVASGIRFARKIHTTSSNVSKPSVRANTVL